MKINKDLAVTIAIRQNEIRNQIQLLKLEKSEAIKEYNDRIKAKVRELQDADEEWRTGAVQMELDFIGEEDEV